MSELIGDYADRPHWVYQLCAGDGSHLYIGCTVNIAQRMENHHAKQWWEQVVRIESEVYPDQRAALDVERALIERHQPTHNTMFTDTYYRDPGGWKARRQRHAAAHAADLICGASWCQPCNELAHIRGFTCSLSDYQTHEDGCSLCRGCPPSYLQDDPAELCAWLDDHPLWTDRRSEVEAWLAEQERRSA